MLQAVRSTIILIIVLFFLSFFDLSKSVLYDYHLDTVYYIEAALLIFLYIILILFENNFVIKSVINNIFKNILNYKLISKIMLFAIFFSFFMYSFQTILNDIFGNLNGYLTKSNYSMPFKGIALLSVTIFPFFEELFFRKSILENIAKLYSNKKAILISALLFMFVHIFNDNTSLLFAFASGIILGYVYMKYGFAMSFLFHLTINVFGYFVVPRFNHLLLYEKIDVSILSLLFVLSVIIITIIIIFRFDYLKNWLNDRG